MATFVLLTLTMILTTSASGSEPTQARGYEEDPWNPMSQQPEILIVKEKGTSSSGSSGMKMKDLTPIICLLAPLILAAILLPSKMTMSMMHSMMTNGNGLMMPGTFPMMIPPGFTPLTAMLASGLSNSKPLGLPIFKSFIESKMFAEDSDQHNEGANGTYIFENQSTNHHQSKYALEHDKGEKENELDATPLMIIPGSGGENTKVSGLYWLKHFFEPKMYSKGNDINDTHQFSIDNGQRDTGLKYSKDYKENDWYIPSLLPNRILSKQNLPKSKKVKGDTENEWSSRVWTTDSSVTSLAVEILKLFDHISRIL